MGLNLVKLCVGAETVDDLAYWVHRRVAVNKGTAWGAVSEHVTRMSPRRMSELLDGGSLYWVIKGVILVRQRIAKFEPVTGSDGIKRCAILLEPELSATEAQPRRAFQGWRYLRSEDAPSDLSTLKASQAPPELRAKLADLGLL